LLNLSDFYILPSVDDLVKQVVRDQPGLVLVAGLEPRRVKVETGKVRWLNSGRAAIQRILMREILHGRPGTNCLVLNVTGEPLPVPREYRARIRQLSFDVPDAFTRMVAMNASKKPDLLVLDRLNSENINPALEAVQNGTTVLAQVDTVYRGSSVARFLMASGMAREQLSALTWVITVQRVPVLCTACRQPVTPDPRQMARLGIDAANSTVTLYRAGSCRGCNQSGYQGEATVFDFFRADPQVPDPIGQPSLLSTQEYLKGLVLEGQLSLEDALDYEVNLLHDTYAMLEEGERALQETNNALQSKVFELQVSNRILVQRTEALVSLQDIAQALITSTSLYEVANRVCRHVRDMCGANRAVVYYLRSEHALEVLAADGWNSPFSSRQVQLAEFKEGFAGSEPKPYPFVPPGISEDTGREKAPVLRTGMLVPLVAQERPVGVMVVHSTQKPAFLPGDVAMLRSFANQAALAMQRADLVEQLRAKIAQLEAAQHELVMKERMERELELAREVQQSVLPRRFPQMPGFEVAARNEPARQVGGDFYDVVQLDDDHFGVVIADVSDKGIPAALYMALARSLILAEAHRDTNPRNVLVNANRLLLELGEPGMFVTVFYGVIQRSTGHLTYVRAGHDQPFVMRGDRLVQLGGQGMALGVLENDPFMLSQEEFLLQKGDRLLLFTDGLVDIQSPAGTRFNQERLKAMWEGMGGLAVDEIRDQTFKTLLSYKGRAEQTDDMTLLVVGVA
jgi:sigma-B regulation protein RsbU (phosphoserine phosphatase)